LGELRCDGLGEKVVEMLEGMDVGLNCKVLLPDYRDGVSRSVSCDDTNPKEMILR
jgi:hypothetical protein